MSMQIKSTLISQLEQSTWLTSETRQVAIRKVHNTRIKLGGSFATEIPK